jgi:hypothetical protein
METRRRVFVSNVVKKCPRCNQEKQKRDFYNGIGYCKPCFNAYNAERRKAGTPRYAKIRAKLQKIRERPMITRAFVEHRLAVYNAKKGYMCEACRHWGIMKKDVPPKCANEACSMLGQHTRIVYPSVHKEQTNYLLSIAACRWCRGATKNCKCSWKTIKESSTMLWQF